MYLDGSPPEAPISEWGPMTALLPRVARVPELVSLYVELLHCYAADVRLTIAKMKRRGYA